MKLVFFGSGAFGVPTLRRLAAAHDVTLVVTQPDRPAGRHRAMRGTDAAEAAEALKLPTLRPDDVNEPSTVRRIAETGPEALVVIAYGQKLGADLLGSVPLAVNLHASLLPRHRGAAPINWAIINGDAETGVTVIQMSTRIDAGDVLAQRATRIEAMDTAGELEQRLAAMGPELVMETLDAWKRGELRPIPQDEDKATRAPRLTKADGTVRFDMPAARVQRRIHGLTPWPGCRARLEGQVIRLQRAALADGAAAAEPGRLVDHHLVACAPGAVRILEVQPAGGRLMPFEDYLRGHPAPPGARLQPL